MTRTASARLAGATFLLYIASGLPAALLLNRATSAPGIAAKLEGIAQHTADMRLIIVVGLFNCLLAFAMGVSLYALTREYDNEIALLAMVCRIGEGALNGVYTVIITGLLWLATTTQPIAQEPAAVQTLAAFLMRTQLVVTMVSATFFAIGSLLFAWAFLRGRLAPAPLAWIGVIASAALVLGVPLGLLGGLRGLAGQIIWLPMLVFEVAMGIWLLRTGGVRRTAVSLLGLVAEDSASRS